MKFDRKETARLRAEIFARAAGLCEACRFVPPEEMDHFWGRREAQDSFNTWALCTSCHRRKTLNNPAAEWWLRRYMLHIARQMLAFPMLAFSWETSLDRCLARLQVLRAKRMA